MSARTVAIDIEKPSPDAVKMAVSVLTGGGLTIYPSDTVYGVLCPAAMQHSVRRVARLKGYTEERPFILLVPSIEDALIYSKPVPGALEAMQSHWPGPVTLILPASDRAPSWVCAPDGSVALRVPSDPLSIKILEWVMPLLTTSANIRGGMEPLGLDEVSLKLASGVDLMLDGGKLATRKTSTMIRVTEEGLEVIRP
jgi:L-threonylcarbamoyladenylate synthase